MLACGNCVYYAMWLSFPPTASWVIIFPIWLLVLSGIRTFGRVRLAAVPSLLVAIPLILAVVFIAPAIIGPPLGFWIPICCIAGTVSAFVGQHSHQVRTTVAVITACVVLSLLVFGARDYVEYNRMPAAEREAFFPPDRRRMPERILIPSLEAPATPSEVDPPDQRE